MAITAIVIGLIGLFSYFITISLTRPLRSCVDFAKAMAGGKLDARLVIRGGGEAADLAKAMNIMAENIHAMVSRIGSSSKVLTLIDNNLENTARTVPGSDRIELNTFVQLFAKDGKRLQQIKTRLMLINGETAAVAGWISSSENGKKTPAMLVLVKADKMINPANAVGL